MLVKSIVLSLVLTLAPVAVHAASICDTQPFSFACSDLGGSGGAGGQGGNGYGGAGGSSASNAASSSQSNGQATSAAYSTPQTASGAASYGAPQISSQYSANVNRLSQGQNQSQGIEFNPVISNVFTPTNTFDPTVDVLVCPQTAQTAPAVPNHIIVSSSPSTYPIQPAWLTAILGPQQPSLSCS